jgi:hypothetical protein
MKSITKRPSPNPARTAKRVKELVYDWRKLECESRRQTEPRNRSGGLTVAE